MRYLVHIPDTEPFLTKWYNADNFVQGMIVYDLAKQLYTNDGVNWKEIEEDSL